MKSFNLISGITEGRIEQRFDAYGNFKQCQHAAVYVSTKTGGLLLLQLLFFFFLIFAFIR